MVLPEQNREMRPVEPSVDDVEFRSLYEKSTYVVETADRWALTITRYKPLPQSFHQPLLGEPLLLVHGFSQNRHAWTSGEFVKNLLYFGIDIHILELRGHGQSSIEAQKLHSQNRRQPPPADLDYDWDIDSYLLYDVPSAVAGVKRVTGHERVFYCGHSMGGILGYGHAGQSDDLEGLITIGAPAELGADFWPLIVAAALAPLLVASVDAALHVRNRMSSLAAVALKKESEVSTVFNYLPVDEWLKATGTLLEKAESNALLQVLAEKSSFLANPSRVRSADILWLLREGGEREPRRVGEQFLRWIRRRELVCYRTGFDLKAGFANIRIPMAIIFGELDPLASVRSTRAVYRAAQSEYLLWRPVKGNSHIELTMGHDIRQICYDIKNLIEYAQTHRHRKPSLPRLR